MKLKEAPQQNPEFTPPKEGWLETVQSEAIWAEEEDESRKELEYGTVILDRDIAIAFIANFHAATIAYHTELDKRSVPEKGSGELERGVVEYVGRRINELLSGKDYVTLHDLYDLSVEKKGNKYAITIQRNVMGTAAVKMAFERATKEELIDLDLIKEWDLGKLYEKLKGRRANR